MNITAYTHVGDYGQMLDALDITAEAAAARICVSGHYDDLSGRHLSGGVRAAEVISGPEDPEVTVRVTLDPFVWRYDFAFTFDVGPKRVHLTKANFDAVKVFGLEEFEALEQFGVPYRLYSPAASGKRPLILFLHGAGEVGRDNLAQMTGTIGALELAKRFPDVYVMAPQARDFSDSPYEDTDKRFSREYRFTVDPTLTPPSLKGERGWNRDDIGKVCDIIRGLISQGRVDPARVYVTGMSMGGGGTIQAVSVAPDLFAAAAPICPTMCGESYGQLLQWPDVPVWITAAYIDHQPGRHAHIYRAVSRLWAQGRQDVRYTIYTPEELADYGIGTTPGLTMDELYAENHNCWIPTLRNRDGILNWLLAQHR